MTPPPDQGASREAQPARFAKLTPAQRCFLELQHSCALCGSELTIMAQPLAGGCLTREEAHCPQCLITTRIKDHPLH